MATSKQNTYNVGGVKLERPFKLRRLGHFGYNVNKMDECIYFYRNLLGFKMSDMNNFAANPERAKLLKEKGIYNMKLRAKAEKAKKEKRKAEGEKALAPVAEEAPEDDEAQGAEELFGDLNEEMADIPPVNRGQGRRP